MNRDIAPELLEKVICIKCLNSSLLQKENGLICSLCGQDIPLYNGIPDFLSVTNIVDGDLSWEKQNAVDYETTISQFELSRLSRIDKPIFQHAQGDVLEIGCGTCRLAAPVERQGARYFGLDPVISFLLYANSRYRLQRLVRGQGESLPFRDSAFDCVISGFYAYRYVNPQLGLPEARRVLKKGGKFVFDLLNNWRLKLNDVKRLIKTGSLNGLRSFSLQPSLDTFEFINLSHLKQQTKRAGFLVEDVMSTPVTVPVFHFLDKYLRDYYYHGKVAIYLGWDVIIILKAI
jgi:SAM-dependent methyltransferase